MATARLLARTRSLVGAAALTLTATAGPIAAHEDDAPLRRAASPYRGVVVDDHTGQPLAAVAVIILWQRLDEQTQGLRRLSGAREVFTDEKGEFTHDVHGMEGRLPPRTFAPRIILFRPGYAPLPARPQLFPPGVAAARFAGAGATIRLAPVTDYEDRAEAFNTFMTMLSATQLFPSTELPETTELIRFELETLGARPMKPEPPGRR
jgi:hypothetical protein